MSPKKAKPTAPPKGASKGSTAKSPSKSSGKASKAPPTEISHMVADNRKARHRFEIMEMIECGLMLRGSEVKSLRNGKCSLEEAYARMRGRELWLVGCDIPEYTQATIWNHEPKRPRKLLLHTRELNRFAGKATEKGLTIVPLRLYFNQRGIAKCEIALCRGLKLFDKREKMKKADANREIQRAMRTRLR